MTMVSEIRWTDGLAIRGAHSGKQMVVRGNKVLFAGTYAACRRFLRARGCRVIS
jgi:hypothetical protein